MGFVRPLGGPESALTSRPATPPSGAWRPAGPRSRACATALLPTLVSAAPRAPLPPLGWRPWLPISLQPLLLSAIRQCKALQHNVSQAGPGSTPTTLWVGLGSRFQPSGRLAKLDMHISRKLLTWQRLIWPLPNAFNQAQHDKTTISRSPCIHDMRCRPEHVHCAPLRRVPRPSGPRLGSAASAALPTCGSPSVGGKEGNSKAGAPSPTYIPNPKSVQSVPQQPGLRGTLRRGGVTGDWCT